MKIVNHLSDDVVLAEIGVRLSRRRLEIEMTQAEVAAEAGVAKRTLERIEAGASAQLSSLIRVLRVLDLLAPLDAAIPEATATPMELLEQRGKTRQRAPRKRQRAMPKKPWEWQE